MKKKIAVIVFGSLFAVVALVVALFYLKGPFVGFPGSRTADARVLLPMAASKLRAGPATWMPRNKRPA
jgi:ABC-type transporter Mla subunit MlaD